MVKRVGVRLGNGRWEFKAELIEGTIRSWKRDANRMVIGDFSSRAI